MVFPRNCVGKQTEISQNSTIDKCFKRITPENYENELEKCLEVSKSLVLKGKIHELCIRCAGDHFGATSCIDAWHCTVSTVELVSKFKYN